jgi:general secretion pathway protein G
MMSREEYAGGGSGYSQDKRKEEGPMKAHRVKSAAQRGVTLIEVMIVVVILGLIAGGVAVAVFPKLKKAQVDTTTTSARALRSVAETWRSEHASNQCPTPQILLNDHAIDSASKITDAWDDPFTIACQEDETVVTSPGPDKKEGTADDIRVPALAQQK